jgi:hypothetical protein
MTRRIDPSKLDYCLGHLLAGKAPNVETLTIREFDRVMDRDDVIFQGLHVGLPVYGSLLHWAKWDKFAFDFL